MKRRSNPSRADCANEESFTPRLLQALNAERQRFGMTKGGVNRLLVTTHARNSPLAYLKVRCD